MKAAEINKVTPAFYRGDVGDMLKKLQNANLTYHGAGLSNQIQKATNTKRLKTVAIASIPGTIYTVDGRLCYKAASDNLWALSYAGVGSTLTKCQLLMNLAFKLAGGSYSKAATDDFWTLSAANDVYSVARTVPLSHFCKCALLVTSAGAAKVAWGTSGATSSDPVLPVIPPTYYHVATLSIRNGTNGANPWTAGVSTLDGTDGSGLGTTGTPGWWGFEGPGALYVPSGYHRRILLCLDASGNPSIEVGVMAGATAAAAEMPNQPEDKAVIAEGILNPGQDWWPERYDVDSLGGGGSFTITPVMFSRGRDFTDID